MITGFERRRLRGAAVAALLATLTAGTAAAEHDPEQDHGVWAMWLAQGTLGSDPESTLGRVAWWFDGHARFFDRTSGYGQSIVRPAIGWRFHDELTGHLGYGWIRDAVPGVDDRDEHRIFQQLVWSHRYEAVAVLSRTRLEQRFVEGGDDTGHRVRQFVKVTWPLPGLERFALAGYDELFLALNDTDWGARSGFDQNRLFLGPQWSLDAAGRVRAEIGYLNRYSRRRGADLLDHLVSVNLLTRF